MPPKIMLNAMLTAGVNTPTAMMIVICAARDSPRNQLIKASNGHLLSDTLLRLMCFLMRFVFTGTASYVHRFSLTYLTSDRQD